MADSISFLGHTVFLMGNVDKPRGTQILSGDLPWSRQRRSEHILLGIGILIDHIVSIDRALDFTNNML